MMLLVKRGSRFIQGVVPSQDIFIIKPGAGNISKVEISGAEILLNIIKSLLRLVA